MTKATIHLPNAIPDNPFVRNEFRVGNFYGLFGR